MKLSSLPSAILTGILFGASMFGAGFCLGTVRVLLLAPAIGEFHAVLVELPLMMIICWRLSTRFVKKLDPFPIFVSSLFMGLFAYATLMLLEVALCLWIFGKTMDETMDDFASPKGRIGISGQVVSSLFPAWQVSVKPKRA